MVPHRQIRAVFNDNSIRVYQAYSPNIAIKTLALQTFVSTSFKIERMTWIKPSFLWMMYRSGWGYKPGQEFILGIDIKREGFEWALNNSILTHFDKKYHMSNEEWKEKILKTPVRIQWDPERDIFFNRLEYCSIQIGLSGIAVSKYINDWIINIEDITEYSQEINNLLKAQKHEDAKMMLPVENEYNLPEAIKKNIGIDI